MFLSTSKIHLFDHSIEVGCGKIIRITYHVGSYAFPDIILRNIIPEISGFEHFGGKFIGHFPFHLPVCGLGIYE